jgi:hypothetical protein
MEEPLKLSNTNGKSSEKKLLKNKVKGLESSVTDKVYVHCPYHTDPKIPHNTATMCITRYSCHEKHCQNCKVMLDYLVPFIGALNKLIDSGQNIKLVVDTSVERDNIEYVWEDKQNVKTKFRKIPRIFGSKHGNW